MKGIWKKPIVIIDLMAIFAICDWSVEYFSYEYDDFKTRIEQSFLDGTKEFLKKLQKLYLVVLKIPAKSKSVETLINVVTENF